MNNRRYAISLASIYLNRDSEDAVFAIGGSNGRTNQKKVEWLIIKKGCVWADMPSLVDKRSYHSSITVNNQFIYVIGGKIE